MHKGVASAPLRRVLLGCNIYVSEGRNQELVAHLQQIARTASHPSVTLVASFADPDYNRTSITLASPDAPALARAARDVAAAALPRVDLTRHSAAHPRLGSVDHVSVHPLGLVGGGTEGDEEEEAAANSASASSSSSSQAAAAALCARMVGAALAAHPCGLPVYYYGGASSLAAEAASERLRKAVREEEENGGTIAPSSSSSSSNWQPRAALADLRRRMGYFSPSTAVAPPADSTAATETAAPPNEPPPSLQSWQGVPPGLAPSSSHALPLQPPPDEPLSPIVADPRAGVCLVGSTDAWVANLNAPFVVGGGVEGEDTRLRVLAAARRVAKRVSERGGGPFKGVQAMALEKRAGVVNNAAASSSSPLFTGDYVPAESGGVVLDAPEAAVQAAVQAAAKAGGEDGDPPATTEKTTTTTTIVEVACNLLSPDAGVEAVSREIERLAREDGLVPAGAAYRIGAAPEELVARWVSEQR